MRNAYDDRPHDTVVPSIAGQVWITALYQMGPNPTDPYPDGFTLTETWLKLL
jgi:proline racemase